MATEEQTENIAALEVISQLSATSLVEPTASTKVYKDECFYCFHTPFFPGGLFICLKTYCCFCLDHVKEYAQRSKNCLFVQVESRKVKIVDDTIAEPCSKITKLAIGSEGGFDNERFQFEDDYHIVAYPAIHKRAELTEDLGDHLYRAAVFIRDSTSAERLEMLQTTSSAWDGEIKQITKHANLEQSRNGKTVPLSGWQCEEGGCDLTENLWLNLTDGAIRCGRSQYIGVGERSKGNGHMQQYYDAKGFPLCVKLGTISKDGSADVFSYDENDLVIDPNIEKHLAHFGIDMNSMEKTEKSVLEMELDLNQKWEYAKLQEDGANLEVAYGPGYTGLINIGSSCYMNSVLQALILIPSFRKRFDEQAIQIFRRLSPQEAHFDFNAQMAKMISSMMSGRYSKEDTPTLNGIKPKHFKKVIAGNHPEFVTAKQQDAEEYARYLLDKTSTSTPPGELDPSLSLKFRMETRFEDLASKQVRYTTKDEVILPLQVKQEMLTPLEGDENQGRSGVHIEKLIEAAFSPDYVDGYTSPITNEQKGASNTRRFVTFPDFLFVQIQKYYFTPDFQAKKLDMDLLLEDTLDLSAYRGTGKKDDEVLLPENVETTVPTLPEFDNNIAVALEQMGFSRNACVKAAIHVFPSQGSVEVAMDWLCQQLDDPSINDPPAPTKPIDKDQLRPCVQELLNFGFTEHQATYALSKHPDANAAAEWLFEHANEVPPEPTKPAERPVAAPESPRDAAYPDGDGKYRLIAIISHMGSSPHSGHYVAHVLKDGRWVLFNDEKVGISQNTPKQLGYLYLYQRI